MNTAASRWLLPTLSRGAGLSLLAAACLLIGMALSTRFDFSMRGRGFEEIKLASRADMPVAIAAARDGSVWFTLEASDAIGRVHNGQVTRISKGSDSIEPLGLVIDGDGSAWFTEASKQRIVRVALDGAVTPFPLSTPVARLGRLALAADRSLWFAEPTVMSVTRLRGGVFTRHITTAGTGDTEPFGVAVAADQSVWATLPGTNELLRIAPDGSMTRFEVPTRNSGLGDIAAAPNGALYFIEMSANKIGRIAGGKIEEFALPTPRAGLTALAVAPDGAAWFSELRGHRIGRLRDTTITEFELPRPDARPIGITVDAANNVWYSDISGWLGRLDAARAQAR